MKTSPQPHSEPDSTHADSRASAAPSSAWRSARSRIFSKGGSVGTQKKSSVSRCAAPSRAASARPSVVVPGARGADQVHARHAQNRQDSPASRWICAAGVRNRSIGAPGRREFGAKVPYVSCSSSSRFVIVRKPVTPFQRARAPALIVKYDGSVGLHVFLVAAQPLRPDPRAGDPEREPGCQVMVHAEVEAVTRDERDGRCPRARRCVHGGAAQPAVILGEASRTSSRKMASV